MIDTTGATAKVVRDAHSIDKEINALKHMVDAGQMPAKIIQKRIDELEKQKLECRQNIT